MNNLVGSGDYPGSNLNTAPAAPSDTASSSGAIGSRGGGSSVAASGPVLMQGYVIVKTLNTPVQAEPIHVPSGCSVTLQGHNGKAAGNSATVLVAQYRDSLIGSGGMPITADSEKTWPVDNLSKLWVTGAAGDGVFYKVQKGA